MNFKASGLPRPHSSPALMDPWHREAAVHLLGVFQNAWDSVACSVCKEAKWKHFPFCRACSIRLQRVGLLKKVVGRAGLLAKVSGQDHRKWDSLLLCAVTFVWDRAQDYLITRGTTPTEDETDG